MLNVIWRAQTERNREQRLLKPVDFSSISLDLGNSCTFCSGSRSAVSEVTLDVSITMSSHLCVLILFVLCGEKLLIFPVNVECVITNAFPQEIKKTNMVYPFNRTLLSSRKWDYIKSLSDNNVFFLFFGCAW